MIKYQPVLMLGVFVCVCEQGCGGCVGKGRAYLSLAGRALEFHQARTPLAGLCGQQWGTH